MVHTMNFNYEYLQPLKDVVTKNINELQELQTIIQ
jgi:hypothetical protein